MQKNNGSKKLLTYLAVFVFFLAFSALYFYPLLQGKILFQSDIMNFVGVSKEAVDHYDTTGDAALWTNSMFGGMPTYQVSLPENGNIFERINIYLGAFLPRPANYMFIALVTFFLLMRSFRVNTWLSISGALCYALGTYLITFMEAGHNTKVNALALMPLVFTGLQYLWQRKWLLGSALTLFAMTCEITANHPQINYYMFLIIAIWGISELVFAIREKTVLQFVKITAVIIAVTLMAVAANTSKLWTTYEYSKESIRGGSQLTSQKTVQDDGLNRDYAFGWSSGVSESFSIMYPNFAGGGSGFSFLQTRDGETIDGPMLPFIQQLYQKDPKKTQEILNYSGQAGKYWGDMPFTSGPIYVGSILCFLFILGALLADNRMRWWLIAATVLSLFLGWGKNFEAFNYWMFDHFPLYNKFRTVSMAMTMLCFTIPVLAIYIVNKFLSANNEITHEKKYWALKWASLATGALSLILMMSGSLFDLLKPVEEEYLMQANSIEASTFFEMLKDARAQMIRTDVLTTTFIIALAAGALWLYLRKTITAKIAIAIICILPVLDLMIVDSKYLGKDNYQEANFYDQRLRSSLPVIKDKDPYYRVWNTMADPDKDGTTSYLYKSIGGYHGAKLQRYQDIIDGYLHKGDVHVLSMLNTKYVIGQRQGKITFDRNPAALGNVWFVDSVRMVKTADEEFNGLANFSPQNTVIVNEEFKNLIPATTIQRDSTASIKLKAYGMDEISYTSKSSVEMPAVFSEIWYRGNQDWKAYIDGKYVDHFRANYLLRGLWVPAGEHEIVFKFEPASFAAGKKVSTASSGLILLLVAIGFFLAGRKAIQENKQTEEQA
ncbi:MAG TPA: hypothetical protein PKO19_10780 [Chitinophagales bacterium]|nr:hypothetical protein [Chitinophagales bacterium]HNK98585.1 hypothetical protein [Chitinophagales bacterium]HNM29518.1 hypothetical protein [Chitinophagales bacterium]HNO28079.1 hypothetical protein [Chitinophagales bacterium]